MRRRAAFTVIELLVVITIIGMLMGLLLPAVNQVRESGRKTACISNLHQIGIAYQSYVTRTGRPCAAAGWTASLRNDLEGNSAVYICPSDIVYLESGEGGGNKPEIIPEQGIDAFVNVRNRTFEEYGGTHNIPFDPSGPRCQISTRVAAPANGAAYGFEDHSDWDWNDLEVTCEPMENGDIKITGAKKSAGYTFDILKGDLTMADGDASDFKQNMVCYVPGGALYTSYGLNDRSDLMLQDPSKIAFLDFMKKVADVVGPDAVDAADWENQVAPRHFQTVNVLRVDGSTGTFNPDQIDPGIAKHHETYWRPINDEVNFIAP
jgi:prepilin-type N-terminal cleavage/methylation domain-containing protein